MFCGSLFMSQKFKIGRSKNLCRQSCYKIENPGIASLVFSQSFVVHKKIDNLSVGSIQPGSIFIGSQRPLIPTFIGKTESDIVA